MNGCSRKQEGGKKDNRSFLLAREEKKELENQISKLLRQKKQYQKEQEKNTQWNKHLFGL